MSDSDDEIDEATKRLLQLLTMLGGASGQSKTSSGSSSTSSGGSTSRTTSSYLDKNYIMVAAIDFGTTFSGYAFSFKTSKKDISMNKNWGAEIGFSSYKTPTCLLLDPQKKFKSFGYAAQKDFSEMEDDDGKKHYYFERFKMSLHNPKVLNKSTSIQAANGKEVPAIDVFGISLKYLKEHLVDALSASMASVSPDLIRWVITVPAIWGDASKQFMREAAFKGGLIDEQDSSKLLIALEPEAASLHIRSLEINQFTGGDCSPGKGDLNIVTGTKYLVIDAGGGTLDVTAHELQSNGKVKEIHFATGGPYGGTKVDAEFEKLMKSIFGAEFIEVYQRECGTQWLTMMSDFEKKKRAMKYDQDSSTNIPLPWSFGTKYQEKCQQSVIEGFKKYHGSGVKFNNGMICISAKIMETLFAPVIKGIVAHISGLLDLDKLDGIEYFFCVGGFSESAILQKAIFDNFSNAGKILIPEEASLAVLKGAVHFGHEPDVISSRVSAKTYGVETMSDFEPFIHKRENAVPVDGKLYCKELFKTFVKKGAEVKTGYSKSIEFSPVRAAQQAAEVEIYSVDYPNVSYITEDGVEHHGNIEVEWPGSGLDRKLEITMTFGGTEVHVSAKTFPGGNTASTKINFLTE